MLTNKVYVNNKGIGREEAIAEAERMSDYLNLSRKSKLHIRLLTEEMLGMVAEIAGDFDAEFWAEHEGNLCRLYLEAEIREMSMEKRENLIKTSTSGKNAEIKGIMGKLKEVVQLYLLGYKCLVDEMSDMQISDYTAFSMGSMSSTAGLTRWSLSEYKNNIEKQKFSERSEEWDELEKSIVANIADDISVGLKGETVMLVITKSI